jgi:hypothetical protein
MKPQDTSERVDPRSDAHDAEDGSDSDSIASGHGESDGGFAFADYPEVMVHVGGKGQGGKGTVVARPLIVPVTTFAKQYMRLPTIEEFFDMRLKHKFTGQFPIYLVISVTDLTIAWGKELAEITERRIDLVTVSSCLGSLHLIAPRLLASTCGLQTHTDPAQQPMMQIFRDVYITTMVQPDMASPNIRLYINTSKAEVQNRYQQVEIRTLDVLGCVSNNARVVFGCEMSLALYYNTPIIALLSYVFHLIARANPRDDERNIISVTPYFR